MDIIETHADKLIDYHADDMQKTLKERVLHSIQEKIDMLEELSQDFEKMGIPMEGRLEIITRISYLTLLKQHVKSLTIIEACKFM